jgi:hypothetical protein
LHAKFPQPRLNFIVVYNEPGIILKANFGAKANLYKIDHKVERGMMLMAAGYYNLLRSTCILYLEGNGTEDGAIG